MNRCGGSNIKIGDKYSVRYVDRVHWFIEIQSKKKNGEKCFLTIGLNIFLSKGDSLFKNVPGPEQFKGRTIVTSPDEVEMNCNYRVQEKEKLKQKMDWRCRNVQYSKNYSEAFLNKQPKEYFNRKKLYVRGKSVKSFKKKFIKKIFNKKIKTDYRGKLNELQLKVIKVFLEKKSKYITDKKYKFKHVILNSPYFLLTQYDPFILKTLENLGFIKNKWWNCRKFANFFHRKPEELLKYINESSVLPQKDLDSAMEKSKKPYQFKKASRSKKRRRNSTRKRNSTRRIRK